MALITAGTLASVRLDATMLPYGRWRGLAMAKTKTKKYQKNLIASDSLIMHRP
ncbi:MAG: hypothetical protein M3Y42_18195 [Actinomycetota bacterium]|nr:hypothetical protein [Actinomycetota bacterium]MDQ2958874.1 hypothetical protein [Actinomycetota bacterium]